MKKNSNNIIPRKKILYIKHCKAYKSIKRKKNNIYTLLRKKLNKKIKISIDKYILILYNISIVKIRKN